MTKTANTPKTNRQINALCNGNICFDSSYIDEHKHAIVECPATEHCISE